MIYGDEVLPKFNFVLFQQANLIGPSLQKMKPCRLPQTKEGSILKYKVFPLWPTYAGEGQHLPKHMENMLRNALRT
jgi:hypothetical protein